MKKEAEVSVPASNVMKPTEIAARKRSNYKKGGHVDHMQKCKDGGKAEKKIQDIKGDKTMSRLDRPARKSGGAVGADTNPFTTASKVISQASASK